MSFAFVLLCASALLVQSVLGCCGSSCGGIGSYGIGNCGVGSCGSCIGGIGNYGLSNCGYGIGGIGNYGSCGYGIGGIGNCGSCGIGGIGNNGGCGCGIGGIGNCGSCGIGGIGNYGSCGCGIGGIGNYGSCGCGVGGIGGFSGYGGYGYGSVINSIPALSYGGDFVVTSVGPLVPNGIAVTSELALLGDLQVCGVMPWVSAVGFETALPAVGTGCVDYSCGSGCGCNTGYTGVIGVTGGYGLGGCSCIC